MAAGAAVGDDERRGRRERAADADERQQQRSTRGAYHSSLNPSCSWRGS